MKPSHNKLLFHADTCAWMYRYRPGSRFYRPPGQGLTAEDIHRYVGVIAEAGVDTLVMNASTQVAWYPSKNLPTILDGYQRGDRSHFYGHVLGSEMTPEQIEKYLEASTHLLDSYLDLAEAGVDWLAETARACRSHGISPWLAIRMNDMHGATKYIEGSFLNCDLYRDPEMRLRGTTHNPSAPVENGWMGLSYERTEVRDHMLRVIRDAVENYDYEGLELDWARWPLCCEPNASQEATDTVTEWHTEVRSVTEGQSKKGRSPYPLGIKYVGTLGQMRSIGVDLAAMGERGIIDFVSPTNSWQSSWDLPCDELREDFGPAVAVHGVIEMAPNYLHGYLPHQEKGNAGLGNPLAVDYRLAPACPPILRGNAAAKLVLGVEAVEVHNFPPADQPGHWPWEDEACHADYSALTRLNDLDFLRGKEKLYTLPSQTGYYCHQIFETVAPFPAILGPGERRACRIPMAAEPDASGLEFLVHVVVEREEALPPIGVYLNGRWPDFGGTPDNCLLFPVATMTHHTPDHLGLNFTLPLSCVREGWNEVVVMNGEPVSWAEKQTHDTVRVVSLELAVRKRAEREESG